MRWLGTSLLLVLLLPAVAQAEGLGDLGSLERSSVETALAARGLAVDPSPDGKRFGTIHVVSLEVFQPSDGRLLEWFNHFHRTTREDHIRRESLLEPGMTYDPSLVSETLRNLRNQTTYSANDPPLSSIVAIVPVQARAADTVDLLVVTRDVWSLRFNSDWNFQALSLNLPTLTASLSENNLFGWRKQAALALVMDQGEVQLGPNYLDPNVLGTRLRLKALFYGIWERKIGQLAVGAHEGASTWWRLEYPFFSLAQPWGVFLDASYTTRIVRLTNGETLARFLPPTDGSAGGLCIVPTAGPEDPYPSLEADCAYRRRYGGVKSEIARSWKGSWLIQRMTIGHELGLTRHSFTPSFPDDPVLREQFAATYFGPSERTSSVFLQYDAFTPRYRTYRNLDTYDLAEDQRLGPGLTLKLGRAAQFLGSEQDFSLFRVDARMNVAMLGGYQSVRAIWASRAGSDGLYDQLIKLQFFAASPLLARSFRVVASGVVSAVANNIHRSEAYLGALQGLRGYPDNTFSGYDYFVGHAEVRSAPVSLWSLRVGGVLFFDAGDAAARVLTDEASGVRGLRFYSDAGAGIRVLIPQLNADVLRCDWGIPFRDYVTDGGRVMVRAGFPGQIFCGFRQVFGPGQPTSDAKLDNQ